MSEDMDFKLDMRGLKQLAKAFKGKIPYAKIGILGQKNSRQDGENSNAGIGAKHEFGDDGMPKRSFLRMPLADGEFVKNLEKTGLLDKYALEEALKSGDLTPWVKRLGVVGVSTILDAFDTGGFGQWKPSNMNYKTNQQTLVETTQLRNSVTFEVV